MKKLTVNKIAIGLFLTGYAASSAFAIHATTEGVINGNAPIIQSKATTPVDHQMTVKVLSKETGQPIGEKPAKVDDTIEITFKVTDADGDKVTAEVLKSHFKVFIKKIKGSTTEAWTPINLTNVTAEMSGDNADEAKISFKITDAFAGAEKIGYQILERTTYGEPYANNWLLVTDIWNRTAGPNTQAWTGADVANPGTGEYGPGDSSAGNTGTGPIESQDTKVGIFKYDGATIDTAKDYSRDGTLIPKYGDKFAAVVWFDTNKDGKLTNADIPSEANGDVKSIIKTGSYTYTWTLSGEYKPAGATNPPAVKADKLTYGVSNGVGDYAQASTGNVILLGSPADSSTKHNANYDSTYLAGAQGFTLTVTTN